MFFGEWGFASRVSAQLYPGSCPRYSKVLSAIFQGPVRVGYSRVLSALNILGSCPRYSKVLSAIFQGPVHFLIFLLCNQTFADQLYIGDVQWSEILVYYIIKNLYDN